MELQTILEISMRNRYGSIYHCFVNGSNLNHPPQ